MRTGLLLCVWLVASVTLGAQGHPCDTQIANGPWVLKKGTPPLLGWCQAGTIEGFIVSVDGALYDLGKLPPAAQGEGIYGVYYEWRWPGGMGKGEHSFLIRAYNGDGGAQGPPATLVFTR